MQKISGDDSLAFEYPDQVHIKLTGKEETWAVVKTKEIESVEVTLAGPSDAIDLDQLAKLGIETELDLSDESNAYVSIHISEEKHMRSRKLRKFLRTHLDGTLGFS